MLGYPIVSPQIVEQAKSEQIGWFQWVCVVRCQNAHSISLHDDYSITLLLSTLHTSTVYC